MIIGWGILRSKGRGFVDVGLKKKLRLMWSLHFVRVKNPETSDVGLPFLAHFDASQDEFLW